MPTRPLALITLSLLLAGLASCASVCGSPRARGVDEYFLLLSVDVPQAEPGRHCTVHKVATRACTVPVEHGLCVAPNPDYREALLTNFPNSYWRVLSCNCEVFEPEHVVRDVCPACRFAERRWRMRHGWPTGQEEECWR